jgi:hypothetical protein
MLPVWSLALPSRSWTVSKAHCCLGLVTILSGTVCGTGLISMVSEVVYLVHSIIHSTKMH